MLIFRLFGPPHLLSLLWTPVTILNVPCFCLCSHLKLVAAVSDASLLPRNGVRGFPHWGVWATRNTRFADDMQAYLEGNQRGVLSSVATRIMGKSPLVRPSTCKCCLMTPTITGI